MNLSMLFFNFKLHNDTLRFNVFLTAFWNRQISLDDLLFGETRIFSYQSFVTKEYSAIPCKGRLAQNTVIKLENGN